MTVYRKTMADAYREIYSLNEDNMDLMRKAAKGAMQTIKFKDGKLKMDSFTASGIMAVYDKINPKNKESMEKMINHGNKSQIMRLQSLAMKNVKGRKEEVEIDEAKSATGYELYHKTFSGAMQHAYAHAKKKFGITVNPNEIDQKVASGPAKPSKGKTNKYGLKGDKGGIQVQVYNTGKNYELNMYKEEVDLNEDNMDLMRKAAKGAMQTIKFKDGKLKVDSFTASGIMQVYDKVNPKNKAAMEKMINSGTKAQIMKLQSFAMKKAKEEIEEKFTKKDFDDNEDNNEHTLNAVELVKMFGDNYEKRQIAQIQKDHDKNRHIVMKDRKVRDALIIKYHPKLKEEVELDEQKFDVKTAETKKGKITVNSFANLKDAKKHLEYMQKKGHKGIISQGGRTVKEEVELDEAPKNYYEIGGDRYDAGVVFTVYVKGKKVHDQILDANDDYEYKGKKYGNVDKAMDAIAKAHGLKVKDFKRVNMEEVELDEKKETAQYTDGGSEKITVTVDNMRKVNIDTVITKNLKPGWKKVEKKSGGVGRSIYDEVDLDEATEKDILAALKKERISGYFSGGTLYVAQRALETARDLLRSMKLKSIPKLVGEHKGTKPHKHPHEDDLEESGMSDLHLHIKDGKSAKEIAKLMKVDVKTIEKLMKGFNEKVDPADVDDDATDDDVIAASKNIMMQLRKAVSLRGKFKVEFGDKKKKEVPARIAQEVQKKYNSLRRPADKEEFQAKIAKSYEDMLKALKENAIKEKTGQDRIVGLVSDKLKEKKHG